MTVNGVEWVWDYVNDKPMKRSEMTHEEWMASERKRYDEIRERMKAQRSHNNKDF